MGKIYYYLKNGILKREEELNEDNLRHIIGGLTKCYLKNGDIVVGYADPLKLCEKRAFHDVVEDYIYLDTFTNLDEKTHKLIGNDDSKYDMTHTKVYVDSIKRVEVIMFSSLKWGGLPTNKFEFNKKLDIEISDEIKIPNFSTLNK